MRELYLYAIGNLLACGAIAFIAFCRLNAMRFGVLLRARLEYAVYVGEATASAFRPPRPVAAALPIGFFAVAVRGPEMCRLTWLPTARRWAACRCVSALS